MMYKHIFLILIFSSLVAFANDTFDRLSKKCDEETLKQPLSLGDERICIEAIKLLSQTTIVKKEEKLSNLLNSAAMIYEAKKNWTNAAKMYEEAIKYKNAYADLAKISLGVMYYDGRGVIKNYTMSYTLWKDVVKNGNDWTGKATNNLDYLCNKHTWACK